MLIQIAEIPDEGLRIEGVADFPHPFEDATWALDGLSLVVDRPGYQPVPEIERFVRAIPI